VHSGVPDPASSLQLHHHTVPNDDEHWSTGSLLPPGRRVPPQDPRAQPLRRGRGGVLPVEVPGGAPLRLESLRQQRLPPFPRRRKLTLAEFYLRHSITSMGYCRNLISVKLKTFECHCAS